MIDNFTTSRASLGRILNIFPNIESEANAITYLGSAIQEIGYNFSTFFNETDEQNFKVENHKVKLPCEMCELTEIEYKGCHLKYNKNVKNHSISKDNNNWIKEDFYFLDYPYLKTSFEEGEIKIYFKKFKTDEQGFLLIPDNSYFKQAIEFFTVYSLILDGEIPKNRNLNIDYTYKMYEKFKSLARNSLKLPHKDQMRNSVKNFNNLTLYSDISNIKF